MSDFSIELSSERIVDVRSRRHFDEVHRCYNTKCYRAAVVVLWTVVVCDLYFKVVELADVYGDATADSILQSVRKKQQQNPKSPDWESLLLEEIANRTELLTSADAASLQMLQQHRHLSAHPALNQLDALYDPPQEVVRAHMRVALDAVLTKPSVMTRKVFDALVEDIEANGPLLPNDEAFQKYIQAKYLSHLGPSAFLGVFRSLWRMCLRSLDARVSACREHLLRCLLAMMHADTARVVEAIKSDAAYSDLNPTEETLEAACVVFRSFPQAFGALGQQAKLVLSTPSEADETLFVSNPFLSESLEKHLATCIQRYSERGRPLPKPSAFAVLGPLISSDVERRLYHELAIRSYGASGSYDQADVLYSEVVQPILGELSQDTQVLFWRLHEANSQCRDRRRGTTALDQFKASLGDNQEDIKAQAFPPRNFFDEDDE